MHELTYNYQIEFHLFQQVSVSKYYVKKSAIIRRIFILAVTLTLGSYLLGLIEAQSKVSWVKIFKKIIIKNKPKIVGQIKNPDRQTLIKDML